MNLHQKLIEIRKEINNFVKDTKGYGYNYVSGSQALSKVRPKMDELGIILKVETKNMMWEPFNYKNNKGEDRTDFIISGEITYTWINADEPTEREETSFSIFGQQDDISKAYGSGLTYSERYFILKTLQAPTDNDDPDAKDTTGRNQYTPTFTSKYKNPQKCEKCNCEVTAQVANFSTHKYGKILCFKCQKEGNN